MDCPGQVPPLHGSRFCFQDHYRFYYAYGNTPAQDFLEYASSDLENKEPSILVLGCGDIRSFFHTIWKNFNPGFKQRFKGVHFMLNDRSAAVLARNIIFLYLCVTRPKSKLEREKWLFALWSIWFCHELLPDHKGILQNTLKSLLKFSVDECQWSSPNNPLHSLVHYSPSATFKEIGEIWSMWYNGEVKVSSVDSMKAARLAEMKIRSMNIEHQSTAGLLDLCGSVGIDLCKDIFTTMSNEYRSYLQTGSVYGESLSGDSQAKAKETSVNFTLYERRDGRYTVHYGSCPFRCFQHTYVCSAKKMMEDGMHITASVTECSLPDPKAFENSPLLSNSFQQFSMWVSCTAHILQSQDMCISFTFNCMDVLEFCQSWEVECSKQFDLIFATNVIDSVAPPAFILAATRLLKDNGYFLSPTMLFKAVSPTAEKYLETTFGFHPKLLPVLCGIRCINHEGPEYACSVSPDHIPLDSSDIANILSSMREKVLIWEKVKMDPLCMEALPSNLDISSSLCSSFLTSCTPLLSSPVDIRVMNCLCTSTSIELLKTFSTRLSTGLPISHGYWGQLCSDLKDQNSLTVFLASIQTQAMLNGLHLHLVVDESTCPICVDLPLSSYLGLFCVEVEMARLSDLSPLFMVLLQKEQPPSLKEANGVQALMGSSQYIDCLAGVSEGSSSTLKIYFHAPLTFANDEYKLALVEYTMRASPWKCFNASTIVLQGELCSKYRIEFSCSLPPHQSQPLSKQSSLLGTLIRHCGNGDRFESTLSFSKDNLPALLTAKLQVEKVSLTEIKIQCLDHSFQIRYPYPIGYNNLIIQRSRKEKALTVKAVREAHQYEDDGQLFHVNPEDHFSLPPTMISTEKLEQLLLLQCTLKERRFLTSNDKSSASPLLKVKKLLLLLLLDENFFFQLVLPESKRVSCLLEIINKVVDVKRRVPAIDLRFCFLDTLPESAAAFINKQLLHLPRSYDFTELVLNAEEYNMLKRVFCSFSTHTMQTAGIYPRSSRPSFIQDCGIESHFKRAVVYPLYPDPDRAAYELSKAAMCSCCKLRVEPQDLKKCARCKNASYCDKKCQRDHWHEHKHHCKNTDRGDKSSANTQGASWSSSETFLPAKQERSFYSPGGNEDSKLKSHVSDKLVKELPVTQKEVKQSQTSERDKQPEYHRETSCVERCSYCQKQTPSLKSCTRCRTTSYCGKKCQIAHWKEHKHYCKSPAK